MGGVGVEIREAGKNARAARIEDEGPRGNRDLGARSNGDDLASLDEHDTVLDRSPRRAVDDLAADDGQNAGGRKRKKGQRGKHGPT